MVLMPGPVGGTVTEHRLPRRASPQAIRLHIRADPENPAFDGTVEMDLILEDPTASIQLHAENLEIRGVMLGDEHLEFVHEGDRLTLHGSFPAGKETITITYTGQVRRDMAGLYLSKDGDRACLATQCEATDARTIVPCFDEPAYKSTWEWTITAPEGLNVLANGPLVERSTDDGWTTHRFAPTAPMSSYLIACCIGDFGSSDLLTVHDTPFRVWAMSGQEQHGDHGNKLAARMLPWFEEYFGQPYAYHKYDQIAVPSFAFGAMENAGLVLFRPSLLLLDPDTASWDDKRHVALVVAHEFAHMWFGNLVTMAWWDDLWLNEAFAEWIAHKCADAMEPDLDVWVPFRQRAAGALATDALSSTHAIYHPVKTPEEAQEMFDAITYGKGSAVMRMLESYLGEEAFCTGLRTYMEEFQFRNARGKDLWKHLGKASGEDVAGIMGDWVNQAGHPTIRVERTKHGLRLHQERTRSSPDAPRHDTLWRVPLVIRYGDDSGVHTVRRLMSGQTMDMDLEPSGALRFVWANAGDGGFYRVALDDELLAGALQHYNDLQPAERVGLLRDLWLQVRSGDLPVVRFLDALAASLGDIQYEVVEYQSAVVRLIDGLLDGRDGQTTFRAWVADAVRPLWAQEAGSDAGRQRRAAVLRILGIANDQEGVAAASDIGARERGGDEVDPQLASAAVIAEALNGDAGLLSTFLATYDERRNGDASPQDVERYLYALASFRDDACIARILKLMAENGVAAQAEGPLLRAMLGNAHAGRATWRHIVDDWDRVENRLGDAWVGIIVEASGEAPVDLADEIIGFWNDHLKGRAGQSFLRAKERLAERKELEARILPDLQAWASQR